MLLLMVLGLGLLAFAAQMPLTWKLLGAAWVLATVWIMGRTLENRPGHARWQWLWLFSLSVPAVIVHQHWGLPPTWAALLALPLLGALVFALLRAMRQLQPVEA
ncbi:hypothetical protein D3C78_1263540 [compost metagenome]